MTIYKILLIFGQFFPLGDGSIVSAITVRNYLVLLGVLRQLMLTARYLCPQ